MAFTDSGLQTEYKGDKRMKKGVNYGIAALVFVLTMALMNGSGILLSVGTALFWYNDWRCKRNKQCL